jgi:hypothetical protein
VLYKVSAAQQVVEPEIMSAAFPSNMGLNLGVSSERPPSQFLPMANATGPISRGPSFSSVPSLGTPAMTGRVDTLYNGGSNGNRQMGMFWANESVKTQYVIVNDSGSDSDARMTKSLSEGMFLFNASQSEEAPHGPITNTIRLFGNKVSVMYDVWAVNAILNAKRDEYDVIAPNAERVFQLWMPMGVLKNEGAPMRNRLGDERFGSRMVNLVVGYRVKTFNIWGGDIDVGTRLFFICKKVPAEANEGNLGHKRSRTRTFGDDASAETQGGKPMVWKIFPYADREHTTPPLHILAYEVDDPRGTKNTSDQVWVVRVRRNGVRARCACECDARRARTGRLDSQAFSTIATTFSGSD